MSEDAEFANLPAGSVVVKKGRIGPVLAGHPWIFKGSIGTVRGAPKTGQSVWVMDQKDNCLGWGVFHETSALTVRMWGFEKGSEHARFDEVLRRRLQEAWDRRIAMGFPNEKTDAFRWVHAEGDRFSGCTVDVFGKTVVARYGSMALWSRRKMLAPILAEISGAEQVVQRVDQQVAEKEGIYGIDHVHGQEVENCVVEFKELGLSYSSDLLNAQKSGHYTDQRDNRARIRGLVEGKRVADLCCSSGGFALNAAHAGAAEVYAADSSGPVLKQGKKNAEANKLSQITWCHDDAIRFAKAQRKRSFDLVILDPPKLVKGRNNLEQGMKKYQAMNAAALGLVADGGWFFTFSCSGNVDDRSFERMLSHAAQKEGRMLHIVERRSAGVDHPVLAQVPESRYLKGVLGVVSDR